MSHGNFPRLVEASDRGIMVLFGDSLEPAVNQAAQAFDAAIRQLEWPEVSEIIPAIRGVLVCYDPLQVTADTMGSRIQEVMQSADWLQAGPIAGRKRWRLPVHYGEESGPDLERVADLLEISCEEVVRQHSSASLRVLMLGFAPGCAYLGSLPVNWDLPRLDYVKPDVPAGSLSVAVRQTVLFATPIPTGWQTIGRTPFRSFTPQREPWFHLSPGDEVCFRAIDQQEFQQLAELQDRGEIIVDPETLA